jgi:hypothetical protein
MQGDQVDEMEGVEKTNPEPNLPLMTADEKRVLELYDRLEELQLEIALLKAQGVLSQGMLKLSIQLRFLTTSRRTGRRI